MLVAFHRVDLHAGPQVDAVVVVEVGDHRPELAGPRPRTIGCGSASSTVTSSPRPWHVAATSAPMNPAPITRTLGPGFESSARERGRFVERAQHVGTPGQVGLVRGAGAAWNPVAMTSPSNATR